MRGILARHGAEHSPGDVAIAIYLKLLIFVIISTTALSASLKCISGRHARIPRLTLRESLPFIPSDG